MLINLSNIQQFFHLNFFWGTLQIEPRVAGSGSKYAHHCVMLAPSLNIVFEWKLDRAAGITGKITNPVEPVSSMDNQL